MVHRQAVDKARKQNLRKTDRRTILKNKMLKFEQDSAPDAEEWQAESLRVFSASLPIRRAGDFFVMPRISDAVDSICGSI